MERDEGAANVITVYYNFSPY